MKHEAESCRYEKAYALQFQYLREDLDELKQRVSRLESTLARGVMLLVANLAGVVISLAQQIIRG